MPVRKYIVFIGMALCMAAMFCTPALATQEPEFRLDMGALHLQQGVSSSLAVSMLNAQGAKVAGIEGLENFDVLSQNSSTSLNIVGNESTYKEEQYYTIMPKSTGEFALKAIVQYNGRAYETNTLRVTVAEGQSSTGEAEPDLFIKTVMPQSDVFLGEKVIVAYELYTRYTIENFGFTDYTAIDGVIAKDTPPDQLTAEYVYFGGVRYAKYEAKRLILDPIKAGVHTIPSFNVQVNVIADNGPGGIFGSGLGGGLGGFLSRTQPLYLQTEVKELTVKPLPAEGRPGDFSGIVGELQLDGRYSRVELNYGDSLSLQITASGNCNLDGLKKIFTGTLPGFTVYETQKNTTESAAYNQYFAQKEFEAILVPETNGAVDIAPVSIPYFNPATEKYERASIPGAAVNVLGDMPQLSSGGVGQAAAMETVRVSQVSYAGANDGYFTIQVGKQFLYRVLMGLGALLAFAVLTAWLAVNRRKQDRTLKSLYRQMMAAADVHEVYRLFGAMIQHCYNLSLKASSQSAVRGSLPDAGIAARVTAIMEYMESPEEKKSSDLKDQIRGVYKMIN